MAAMDFIEFDSWEALEDYCKKNLYTIKQRDGYSVIADIFDKNGVHYGDVSNNPGNYKCKNPNTKYVLVWE